MPKKRSKERRNLTKAPCLTRAHLHYSDPDLFSLSQTGTPTIQTKIHSTMRSIVRSRKRISTEIYRYKIFRFCCHESNATSGGNAKSTNIESHPRTVLDSWLGDYTVSIVPTREVTASRFF
eukprot:TRINITY_DN21905_c0_g1_i1.p1 TRINITY_DN21905_c0_g1~~TRINITY_DN21905_c0_g1_i1.p1  ORF type:complete len:121 (-),score=8.47 TRINITY_DN21905_c0_g1_i1:85-447(-)